MLGRVIVVSAMLLLAAAAADAKGPVGERSDTPDPRGLTMGGGGLARVTPPRRLSDETIRRTVAAARPTAVSRAVNEARRRAAGLARVAGLTLGDMVAVEAQQSQAERFGPFGEDRFCRRPRRPSARPRCRVPKFAVALVTVTFATRETDAAPEPDRTVTADGEGRASVEPENRSSRSIRRAILEANAASDAPAFESAREQAATLARSAGFALGTILSIAQQGTGPFGEPLFEIGAFGPFGPGDFCGTIRRPIFRRDPQTGRRRVVRRVRERRCFFPRSVTTSLRVTFASN